MLLSTAYVLIVGMAAGWLCRKLYLLGLAGMIPTEIVLGPYALDLINGSILGTSAEFRKIALIIILIRAGLSLDVDGLKQAGCPAILMCFVPVCFEIIDMVALTPRLLGISMLEVVIIGSVVAAVSLAVVMPKVIRPMGEGRGIENNILQLILAGASVDDVFVTVLFSAFTDLAQGVQVSAASFAQIPLSILADILVGAAVGILLAVYFKKMHIKDTVKVTTLPRIPFVLVSLKDSLKDVFGFSSFISVMCMGIALQEKQEPVTRRLSLKFNKLWIEAEILLLVLVGATVDISYAAAVGGATVLPVLGVPIFRMAGAMRYLMGTKPNLKERTLCMAAYIPKATVQAAIGGVPLSTGLAYGNIVLTVTVLAILIIAPLGALLVDLMHRRWSTQEH